MESPRSRAADRGCSATEAGAGKPLATMTNHGLLATAGGTRIRWRRPFAICVVVALPYLATWLGGWRAYAAQLQASAKVRYGEAEAIFTQDYPAQRNEDRPIFAQLRAGGPATGVYWAFPLLPGVLLVEDYENLGPLNQRGGVKVLLYYGAGTVVLANFGWIT